MIPINLHPLLASHCAPVISFAFGIYDRAQ